MQKATRFLLPSVCGGIAVPGSRKAAAVRSGLPGPVLQRIEEKK
jgi:hypothetical protein